MCWQVTQHSLPTNICTEHTYLDSQGGLLLVWCDVHIFFMPSLHNQATLGMNACEPLCPGVPAAVSSHSFTFSKAPLHARNFPHLGVLQRTAAKAGHDMSDNSNESAVQPRKGACLCSLSLCCFRRGTPHLYHTAGTNIVQIPEAEAEDEDTNRGCPNDLNSPILMG